MRPQREDIAAGWQNHWQARWDGRWSEQQWSDSPGARGARLWVPVVISFLVQVPAAIFAWRYLGEFRSSPFLLGVAVALAGPLALIAARRFPGPVVAIVTAAAAADVLLTPPATGPPYIALAFAIIGAIARGARMWAWISVATGWIVTLVLAGFFDVDWNPFRVTATSLGILIVLGLGESFRTRRERMDRMRRSFAERKQSEAQAERVRIARELHDVLAHSLSQINVQAGVGLHLLESRPEQAAAALASIKETSKTALDEVRSVLGVLRSGSDAPLVPEPDLSRLPRLIASVTAQGVTVTLDEDIAHAPPAAVQLAIYRIVQEALTNVVRHSGASTATVAVHESSDVYQVAVQDDGRGPVPNAPTDGRGLLGMRERAELLGGQLRAGAASGGGFSVIASIPAQRSAGAS